MKGESSKPRTIQHMQRAFKCYVYWKHQEGLAQHLIQWATSIADEDALFKRRSICYDRARICYKYLMQPLTNTEKYKDIIEVAKYNQFSRFYFFAPAEEAVE